MSTSAVVMAEYTVLWKKNTDPKTAVSIQVDEDEPVIVIALGEDTAGERTDGNDSAAATRRRGTSVCDRRLAVMAYQTLTQALDELERTDPAVARAAANYDRTVWRLALRRRVEARALVEFMCRAFGGPHA